PGERDHADAPRPDATLSCEPAERAVPGNLSQPLEVDCPHEARERRGAARSQAARAEGCRREAGEGRARRQARAASPDHRTLDLARSRGLDELPADRTQD